MTRFQYWLTAGVLLLCGGGGAHAAPPPAFKACATCHLATGQGVPGAYPPLSGRIASIASTSDGRRYLVAVPTFGLSGKVTIGTTDYRGVMPRQGGLSASDLAGILNYLATDLGGGKSAETFKPFTAAEVEKLRKINPAMSPADVAKLRATTNAAAGQP